jgi:hypothetical protein
MPFEMLALHSCGRALLVLWSYWFCGFVVLPRAIGVAGVILLPRSERLSHAVAPQDQQTTRPRDQHA